MDTTQLLLLVVLSITTILLIFVGIQLIFVLREVRKTLRRINRVIEGFENLGVNVNQGFSELTGFIAGIKTLIATIEMLKDKKNDKK